LTQEDQNPLSNMLAGYVVPEPSTSAPDESLDETEPESTTTSSTNLKTMDLDSLSPRGEAIKLLLADEMSDGYNLTTLAKELGLSPSSASTLIQELRNELLLQTSAIQPLADEEYQALKDSIAADGVRVPVMIGEHGLIDGRHRWRASKELGLKEIPALFIAGLSKEQERDVAITVNAARRQMSREQKHAIIRAEISRNPARSSREIARVCGVTHPTVEGIRLKMKAEEEVKPSVDHVASAEEDVERIFHAEKRVDTLGREYEVPVREPKPAEPAPRPDQRIGYMVCTNCQARHNIFKDGDGPELRAERA
jgi:hypothetical protein